MGKVFNKKAGSWVDMRSSTDSTLHGRGRALEKSSIFLNADKKRLKGVIVILNTMCSVLKMQ